MTITVGAEVQFTSSPNISTLQCVALSTSQGVAVWTDDTLEPATLQAVLINFDSALIITSIGTEFTVPLPSNAIENFFVADLGNNIFAITFRNATESLAVILCDAFNSTTILFGAVFDVGVGGVTSGCTPNIAAISSTRFVVFFGDANTANLKGSVFSYVGTAISAAGFEVILSTVRPTFIASGAFGANDFAVSFKSDVDGSGKQVFVAVSGLSMTAGALDEFEEDGLDFLGNNIIQSGAVDAANILRTYKPLAAIHFVDLVRLSGTNLIIDQHQALPNDPNKNTALSANSGTLAMAGDLDTAGTEISITPPTISQGVTQTAALSVTTWMSAIDGQRALCVSFNGESYIANTDVAPVLTDWDLSESPEGIPGRDTT